MSEALPNHYAKALADAVFAPNSGLAADEASRQLSAAADLLAGSRELQLALLSPAVSKSRKSAVVSRLADELGLHRLIRNFLLVVVQHRRATGLPAMRKSFDEILDEREGWIRAEIASARELDTAQRESIERALGTKLGKFIRAHYVVDPSVIGGIRAHVGSKEYDATVRGKLEGMRQRLVSGW
jgi:F-type H+-transporting ATPase subunit delta